MICWWHVLLTLLISSRRMKKQGKALLEFLAKQSSSLWRFMAWSKIVRYLSSVSDEFCWKEQISNLTLEVWKPYCFMLKILWKSAFRQSTSIMEMRFLYVSKISFSHYLSFSPFPYPPLFRKIKLPILYEMYCCWSTFTSHTGKVKWLKSYYLHLVLTALHPHTGQ